MTNEEEIHCRVWLWWYAYTTPLPLSTKYQTPSNDILPTRTTCGGSSASAFSSAYTKNVNDERNGCQVSRNIQCNAKCGALCVDQALLACTCRTVSHTIGGKLH